MTPRHLLDPFDRHTPTPSDRDTIGRPAISDAPSAATTLQDLRNALVVWLATASALPTSQVLPVFRWLCEVRGSSFEEPSAECLEGVLESLRAMALVGGSSRCALEAQIAPFRTALAEL